MYWCVRREESAENGENPRMEQEETLDMGGQQSTTELFSSGQTSGDETIQSLYRSGDFEAALQLVQAASRKNLSQEEKGHLLSLSTTHGDLQAVRYLLKEAGVTVSLEPSDDNPAVRAAYFGHKDIAQELLDSFLGATNISQLLNWMLVVACQQGHLEVVQLLVLAYRADPDSYAVRKNEFPVLLRLPLYAAMQAGHDDVAAFLLENGSFFCSYTLMDCPKASKRLLCKYFIEPVPSSRNVQAKPGLSVNWSRLRLPWVDFDWLIDLSHQITELDLSANHLSSLPSIIPWGLMNLQKLNLSDNRLKQLLDVKSSEGIICTKYVDLILTEMHLGVIVRRPHWQELHSIYQLKNK